MGNESQKQMTSPQPDPTSCQYEQRQPTNRLGTVWIRRWLRANGAPPKLYASQESQAEGWKDDWWPGRYQLNDFKAKQARISALGHAMIHQRNGSFVDQDSESCLYHIEHVYIQSLQSWDPSYPVSFVGDMWTPLVEKTWEEYCDVSNYGTNTRSMVPKRLLSSFSWILCLEPVNWLGLGCCLDRWVGLVSLDVCRQHPLSFLQPQPLTFRQQKTVRYETVFNTEMQRIDGNCQCPLQATELGFHTLHYMTWKIH